jgi:uncharacterized protein
MVVGVLQLDLHFHDPQSLKAKRGVLKQLMSKIRNTFEVAVAEVGDQDLWQRARIGVTTIGSDRGVVNTRLDHVINFVESIGTAEILNQRIELINL